MKITVLVDNSTLVNRYGLLAEPAISFYLEDDGIKVLFDCGFSDIVCRNAATIGVDLLDLDYVVLSHGHLDHSWGLASIVRLMTEAHLAGKKYKRPRFVAHPLATAHRFDAETPAAGSMLSWSTMRAFFSMEETTKPRWLTTRLAFMGEIERIPGQAVQRPPGAFVTKYANKESVDDLLLDDTALAYKTADGVVIITGCSHSGICSIARQATLVCETDTVVDIIGGLHLINATDDELQAVICGLHELNVSCLHACHCTDLRSKIALANHFQVQEVGVGLQLEYP